MSHFALIWLSGGPIMRRGVEQTKTALVLVMGSRCRCGRFDLAVDQSHNISARACAYSTLEACEVKSRKPVGAR